MDTNKSRVCFRNDLSCNVSAGRVFAKFPVVMCSNFFAAHHAPALMGAHDVSRIVEFLCVEIFEVLLMELRELAANYAER